MINIDSDRCGVGAGGRALWFLLLLLVKRTWDTSDTASARPGKSKYWSRAMLSRRDGGREVDSKEAAREQGEMGDVDAEVNGEVEIEIGVTGEMKTRIRRRRVERTKREKAPSSKCYSIVSERLGVIGPSDE